MWNWGTDLGELVQIKDHEPLFKMVTDTFFPLGHTLDGNVRSVENGYELDLPGVGKDAIEITDKEGHLEVKWTDKRSKTKQTGSAILPVPLHESVVAKYEDGVLSVTWKEKKDKSKKIAIT